MFMMVRSTDMENSHMVNCIHTEKCSIKIELRGYGSRFLASKPKENGLMYNE
jgi:hypothetical protein